MYLGEATISKDSISDFMDILTGSKISDIGPEYTKQVLQHEAKSGNLDDETLEEAIEIQNESDDYVDNSTSNTMLKSDFESHCEYTEGSQLDVDNTTL